MRISRCAALVLAVLVRAAPLPAQDPLNRVEPATEVRSVVFRFEGKESLDQSVLRQKIAAEGQGSLVWLRKCSGSAIRAAGRRAPLRPHRDAARRRSPSSRLSAFRLCQCGSSLRRQLRGQGRPDPRHLRDRRRSADHDRHPGLTTPRADSRFPRKPSGAGAALCGARGAGPTGPVKTSAGKSPTAPCDGSGRTAFRSPPRGRSRRSTAPPMSRR